MTSLRKRVRSGLLINNRRPTLLLVDFNNLFYRGSNVHSQLEHNGEFIGGLYGFVNQLASTASEVSADMIVICKDAPPYLRSVAFPSFKAGRSKVEPEWGKQLQRNKVMCDRFLEFAGIPVLRTHGLEADDIMALLASNCTEHEMVIASNDSDLYQLLQDGVSMYRGKDKGYFTLADFEEKYGKGALGNWVEVLALSGGHNGVPNVKFPGSVKGIGEKTALQIVRGEMRLARVKSLYHHRRKQIERNRKLCKLPYPYHRINKEDLVVPEKGELKERQVMRYLIDHSIQYTHSIKSMLDRVHRAL